jgi:hypothetical protein
VNTNAFFSLYERYESQIYEIRDCCTGQLTGPFLIAPGEKYWNSKPRIAFVGQETHGWHIDGTIRDRMNNYLEFNMGEKY